MCQIRLVALAFRRLYVPGQLSSFPFSGWNVKYHGKRDVPVSKLQ